MHWLTPVPGGGAGACTFVMPKGGHSRRLRRLSAAYRQVGRVGGSSGVWFVDRNRDESSRARRSAACD
jgi:hypothetical protein